MALPVSGARIVGYQAGSVDNTQETMRAVLGAQAGLLGGVPDPSMLFASKGSGMDVDVSAGNALVRDPSTRQAYAVSFDADSITINTTGASTRSDLVVLRVADEFAGDGVFIPGEEPLALSVIQDVPNTTMTLATLTGVTHPAIPIARVDLPTNCTSINDATLVPLTPSLQTQSRTEARVLVAAVDEQFPTTDGNLAGALQPVIHPPTWARRALLTTTVHGLDLAGSGTATFTVAAQIGATIGQPVALAVPVAAIPISVTATCEQVISAVAAGQPIIPKVLAAYSTSTSGVPWVRQDRTVIAHTVVFEG